MISAENIGLSWSIRNRNCLCQQYFHYIREKWCTFVESLSYIITTMIGYNSLNGFTKDYNMWNGNDRKQTMEGRKVISIVNITLWIMWANNQSFDYQYSAKAKRSKYFNVWGIWYLQYMFRYPLNWLKQKQLHSATEVWRYLWRAIRSRKQSEVVNNQKP